MAKFVDHHALEDVRLVVDVVEDIAPEWVEGVRWHKETTGTHPKPVGECSSSKSNDEDWDERTDKHDQGLSGDEIEEEPHHPCEEGLSRWSEVGEPVSDHGEQDGVIRKRYGIPGEEVGDNEGLS